MRNRHTLLPGGGILTCHDKRSTVRGEPQDSGQSTLQVDAQPIPLRRKDNSCLGLIDDSTARHGLAPSVTIFTSQS
jgi:hypothetical protein